MLRTQAKIDYNFINYFVDLKTESILIKLSPFSLILICIVIGWAIGIIIDKRAMHIKSLNDQAQKKLKDYENRERELEKNYKEKFSTIDTIVEQRTEDIEKSRKTYQALIENIGDIFFTMDTFGFFTYFNPTIKKITGYNKKSLLKHHFKEIIGKDSLPIFIEAFQRNLKGEKIQDLLFHLKDKNSRLIQAELNSNPIFREGKVVGIQGIIRDISVKQEIDRIKSDFVKIASHQLRTPLTSMRWLLETLVNKKLGKFNDKQEDYIRDVYRSSKRMVKLVNDLLDVSKIESNEYVGKFELVSLNDIIEEIILEIQAFASSKNVKISFLSENKKFPEVKVDKIKIKQVIENLISNALLYNKPKGRVDIDLEESGKFLIFKCQDTGIGIPKREKRKFLSSSFVRKMPQELISQAVD